MARGNSLSPEQQWGTLGCTHTVLIVARTLTSAARLLEAVDLLRGDTRIRFLFTVFDTSQFSSGVERMLWDNGVDTIVPWREVPALSYDLALCASENIDTEMVTGPVLILPHGLGFNKYVPAADGASGMRIAGLPPSETLRRGRVHVVLSHSDQERQLVAAQPDIAGRTVVTGDPAYDRLLASQGLRDRYRAQFDCGGRRLVLVSSTWRPNSTIGQWRTLPRDLLAELGVDEIRLVLTLHPNIWSWYGTHQIETWLADDIDAGLVLLPAGNAWQAALIAADQVVVDHGSLSLYAAALGKPVLLAGTPDDIVPGTPIEQLWHDGDRINPDSGLRAQLDAAMASDPHRYDHIVESVFSHVGEATTRLRQAIYRELDLALPDPEPDTLRIADIPTITVPITGVRVHGRFESETTLRLDRFPARLPAHPSTSSLAGIRHLAATTTERSLRLLHLADVVASHTPVADIEQWAERTLARFPAAQVVVAPTERDAASFRVFSRSEGDGLVVSSTRSVDVLAIGSTAFHCLITDRWRSGTLTVHLGAVSLELVIALQSN